MLNWILGYQNNTQQPPAAPAPETVASEVSPTAVEQEAAGLSSPTAAGTAPPHSHSPAVDLLEEGDGSAVIIHMAPQSEAKVDRSNEEEDVGHSYALHSEAQSVMNTSLPKPKESHATGECNHIDDPDCHFTSSSDEQSPTLPVGAGLRVGEGKVDESAAESWIFIGSSEGKGCQAIHVGAPPPLEVVALEEITTTEHTEEDALKRAVLFTQEECGAESGREAIGSSLSHSITTCGQGDATSARSAPLPALVPPAVRDAPVRLEKGARHAIIADEEEAWRSLWWRFDQLKASIRTQRVGSRSSGGYPQDLSSSCTSSASPSAHGASATAEPVTAFTDSAVIVAPMSAPSHITDEEGEGTTISSTTAVTNSDDAPDAGTTCVEAEETSTLMCDAAPTTIFTSSSSPAHPVEGRDEADRCSTAPHNTTVEEEEEQRAILHLSEQQQREGDAIDEVTIEEVVVATTATPEVTTEIPAGPNSACHGTNEKEELVEESHSVPSSVGSPSATRKVRGENGKSQLTSTGATQYEDAFVDNNACTHLPTPPLAQASITSTTTAATSSPSSAVQSKNKRKPSKQSSVSCDSLVMQQCEVDAVSKSSRNNNKSDSATNTVQLLTPKASNQPPPPPPPYHLAVASDADTITKRTTTATDASTGPSNREKNSQHLHQSYVRRPSASSAGSTPSPSSSSRQQSKAGSEANSVRSDVRGPPPPYPYPLGTDDFTTAARCHATAAATCTSATTAGSTEASNSANSSTQQTNSSSSSRKGSHQRNRRHHHRGRGGGATVGTIDDDASVALAISLREQDESELMEMQQALARQLQAEEDAKIRRQQPNTDPVAGNGESPQDTGARRCDCLGARRNIHRKGCPMQKQL